MPPKRNRTSKYSTRACARCYRRKQACDRERPCGRCVAAGLGDECVKAVHGVTTRRWMPADGAPVVEAFEHAFPGNNGTERDAFDSLVAALGPELDALAEGNDAPKRVVDAWLAAKTLGNVVALSKSGTGRTESYFDLAVELQLMAGLWDSDVPTFKRQCCAEVFGASKVAISMNRAFLKMMGFSPHTNHWMLAGPLPEFSLSPVLAKARVKAGVNAIAARLPKLKFDSVLLHTQFNVPVGHITYTPFRVTEVVSYTYNTESPPRLVTSLVQYLNVQVPDVKEPGPLPTGPDVARDAAYMTAEPPMMHEPPASLGDGRYRCVYGLPREALPEDPIVGEVPPIIVCDYGAIMNPQFRASMYAQLADVYHEGNMMEPVTVPFIPADASPKTRWWVGPSRSYIVYDMEAEVAAGKASFRFAAGVTGEAAGAGVEAAEGEGAAAAVEPVEAAAPPGGDGGTRQRRGGADGDDGAGAGDAALDWKELFDGSPLGDIPEP